MSTTKRARIATVLAVLVAVSILLLAVPRARAVDDLDSLNAAVEQSGRAYDQAVAQVEQIEQQIADNQASIEALQADIQAHKSDSDNALRALYKYQRQRLSLINLVFSADSFEDMFVTLDYLQRYEQVNLDIIHQQSQKKAQLEQATEQLQQQLQQAEVARAEAQEALAQAENARQEAMERAAAEAAAQLAAAQAAAQQQASQESQPAAEPSQADSTASDVQNTSSAAAQEPAATPSAAVSSGDVNWQVDKQQFINEWGPRIDAYLAGSALAGYGTTFATAAWNYGVDPRWSPAISCIESGKGASCFRSHNAWGWGSASWGSWEEAIDAHVSGLARIYGSTITYEGACKYCPPNGSGWYNRVLQEMNSI